MKKKSMRGQEAIEFVLLAALVFFATLFVVIIFGNKLANFFSQQSSVAATSKSTKDIISSTSKEKYKPDYFEPIIIFKKGKPTAPEKLCRSGRCRIDFGNYSLNTLDDKGFNEAVKTTGTSGGTSKVVNIMDQIVSILNTRGKIEDAKKVKALSILGHNLATMEEQVENLVNTCKGNKDCINSKITKEITKPQNYDESLGPYKKQSFQNLISKLDWAAYHKQNTPELFQQYLNENVITAQMLVQLDQVAGDKKIDPNLQGMIKELTYDMVLMAENLEGNFTYLTKNETEQGYSDPITGKYLKEKFSGDPYETFKNYSASQISNFKSALICAAAGEKDNGKACHDAPSDSVIAQKAATAPPVPAAVIVSPPKQVEPASIVVTAPKSPPKQVEPRTVLVTPLKQEDPACIREHKHEGN